MLTLTPKSDSNEITAVSHQTTTNCSHSAQQSAMFLLACHMIRHFVTVHVAMAMEQNLGNIRNVERRLYTTPMT